MCVAINLIGFNHTPCSCEHEYSLEVSKEREMEIPYSIDFLVRKRALSVH